MDNFEVDKKVDNTKILQEYQKRIAQLAGKEKQSDKEEE